MPVSALQRPPARFALSRLMVPVNDLILVFVIVGRIVDPIESVERKIQDVHG